MGTPYSAARGDCVASIAARFGFGDPEEVYGDPDNADLREARPNWNVLRQGDRVTVPDRELGNEPAATGKKHRFQVKRPRVEIVVKLLSERDEPLPNAKCELVIGDERHPITSDGDGFVRAPIDPERTSAELYVWADDPEAEVPSDAFLLDLGALPPARDIAGAQARLANLGYFCGGADGDVGPRTRHALKAFQLKAGKDITGELDEDTQRALEEAHGC